MGEYADDAIESSMNEHFERRYGRGREDEEYTLEDDMNDEYLLSRGRNISKRRYKKKFHELNDIHITNLYNKYKKSEFYTSYWADIENEYNVRQLKPRFNIDDGVVIPTIKIYADKIEYDWRPYIITARRAYKNKVLYDLKQWDSIGTKKDIEEDAIFNSTREVEQYIQNNIRTLKWLQAFHKKQLRYEKYLSKINTMVVFGENVDKAK